MKEPIKPFWETGIHPITGYKTARIDNRIRTKEKKAKNKGEWSLKDD